MLLLGEYFCEQRICEYSFFYFYLSTGIKVCEGIEHKKKNSGSSTPLYTYPMDGDWNENMVLKSAPACEPRRGSYTYPMK